MLLLILRVLLLYLHLFLLNLHPGTDLYSPRRKFNRLYTRYTNHKKEKQDMTIQDYSWSSYRLGALRQL